MGLQSWPVPALTPQGYQSLGGKKKEEKKERGLERVMHIYLVMFSTVALATMSTTSKEAF